MRLQIGPGATRPPYVFRPEGGADNIAVLSGIGQTVALDTQVVVAWLREDDTIDKDLKPAFGWRAVVVDSLEARAQGLDIRGRYFDSYGFHVKSGTQVGNTFTGAELPPAGVLVNFYLVNPAGERVFGPVPVTFKTP
jgi:hypothetical protein